MLRRVFAAFLITAIGCARPAAADPVDLSAAITANFLDGAHVTETGIDRVSFVPLPLASLDARWRMLSLHLEALPSVTFGYGQNDEGAQATRLSILNPALRVDLTPRTFIGIGQTIYNQSTTYGGQTPFVGGIVAEQHSRVTGFRLEAGQRLDVSPRAQLTATFAVNPSMQGVQYSSLVSPFFSRTVADPENATQIDTSLTLTRRAGRGSFIYGVRYLNYTAHYRAAGTPADGALADRNAGFMPTIGYRF